MFCLLWLTYSHITEDLFENRLRLLCNRFPFLVPGCLHYLHWYTILCRRNTNYTDLTNFREGGLRKVIRRKRDHFRVNVKRNGAFSLADQDHRLRPPHLRLSPLDLEYHSIQQPFRSLRNWCKRCYFAPSNLKAMNPGIASDSGSPGDQIYLPAFFSRLFWVS